MQIPIIIQISGIQAYKTWKLTFAYKAWQFDCFVDSGTVCSVSVTHVCFFSSKVFQWCMLFFFFFNDRMLCFSDACSPPPPPPPPPSVTECFVSVMHVCFFPSVTGCFVSVTKTPAQSTLWMCSVRWTLRYPWWLKLISPSWKRSRPWSANGLLTLWLQVCLCFGSIFIYRHMPIGMLFQSITYLLVSGVLSSFNLLKRTYFYVILMWDERGPICYVIKGGSFFMLLKGTCFYVIKGDPEQRCICGPMDYNWAHCIFCWFAV